MDGSSNTVPNPDHSDALESAVVRFAGDSGDGMQLTGGQFTLATAVAGNDLATFPDFPAEIRAPVGTTYGVSAFQIHFGARKIRTIGDMVDVLVVMNPAALITNLNDLRRGGLIIADAGSFTDRNLRKAGYEANPLEDGSLDAYRIIPLDIQKLTQDAVADCNISNKEALRTKNLWSLGLVLWMFERDTGTTLRWLEEKFAGKADILAANKAALKAGHAFGETAEISAELPLYHVPPADIPPGLYRNITGAEALAWGLTAGCRMADLGMTFCSYPITPASQLLHVLSKMRDHDVLTFQAEDEIAAACAAIGASYAGKMGVTSSSGPGIALKTEALGLAIATELPLVVVNAQRGGPSTGLPTKTEQSDLFQAVFGRNSDAPMPVLAARTASDCFDVAIEAVRLATKYMTPVMLLTDGYLQNASEPWRIPDLEKDYEHFAKERIVTEVTDFHPYDRDGETLARPWAVPGTPGLMHRIGGIERADVTGNISYDPDNHQKMTDFRRNKILGIADDIAPQEICRGPEQGVLAILGWGSTFGPIHRAVGNMNETGLAVSHIHLRHIWPLPANLADILDRFDHVLIPEMNDGQLFKFLRAELLLEATSLRKVTGKPFKVHEIETAAAALLEGSDDE
ncbi:2-oxoacid:acceptor oxidoreductase subunit alpha [Aestuariispira insulae]|uniref:2-oxoglutarate ferredoxin oxidoreductase subunit alpha n=1 Tax=Aestuariispira insulae TaxID=1461337 RepID=A0A3D9HEX0_9PROT|nr:2-oxoacid:acceptor oxidoreductase subunit alpha [Aestuariispira insulae]RED48013.1 2-oxoglutarate ferredoxin oxidoreductase subunit alpha [Aestuariispira insulae]